MIRDVGEENFERAHVPTQETNNRCKLCLLVPKPWPMMISGSCPHTHQQNGTVERKHRHIIEVGLTLLSSAGLPHLFWTDAFSNAIHVINRLPTSTLKLKSPYEILFKKLANYFLLKPFRCACYPHLRPFNSHKMDFRSSQCIFIWI
uniref:Retrovirus-related Pol polyprotein from transposon TNT 1-94 n=1 Tax=Cajanus cajan TaxID=3821 RepID=A0A151T8Z0_CAJCA|nr:Retrovirus-related Pol polyprotein from transposon TNT 1-94 [Cajanus cajan]